jgi:hypothetical protein
MSGLGIGSKNNGTHPRDIFDYDPGDYIADDGSDTDDDVVVVAYPQHPLATTVGHGGEDGYYQTDRIPRCDV